MEEHTEKWWSNWQEYWKAKSLGKALTNNPEFEAVIPGLEITKEASGRYGDAISCSFDERISYPDLKLIRVRPGYFLILENSGDGQVYVDEVTDEFTLKNKKFLLEIIEKGEKESPVTLKLSE